MADKMSIRKHVEYSQGKFHGYIDVGSGVDDDSNGLAKNALVVMAVSLTEGWKIPIGYFLIDGMSGEEQANVIEESLIRLYDIGVTVVSVTCDGPTPNIAMLRSLGVNVDAETPDPSFQHPADPSLRVSVFLDVCHMLKLLRGAFTSELMTTPDGRVINWDYIKALNNLQEKEGLRLANKLKTSHVLWRNQKMNVKLAAQVFSCSVANALEYCNTNLKLLNFKDVKQL